MFFHTAQLFMLWTPACNNTALFVPINPFLFSQPADRLMPLFDFYFSVGSWEGSGVARGQDITLGHAGGSGLSRLQSVFSDQLNPNGQDHWLQSRVSLSWTITSLSLPPVICHGGMFTTTREERGFLLTATGSKHHHENLSCWRVWTRLCSGKPVHKVGQQVSNTAHSCTNTNCLLAKYFTGYLFFW